MRNLLIESKKIYSNKIINLLYIKIYEGIYSIYSESLKLVKGDNLIKMFQLLLKRILDWDDIILEQEKLRIMGSNKDLIVKILKAITKINLKILTNTNDNIDIDEKILNTFIHNIYKYCYVAIWDNPFLFIVNGNNTDPQIVKKNQREVYIIIKESISRALDELIDLNNIIDKFLELDLDKEDKILNLLAMKMIELENKVNNPIQLGGDKDINITDILNKNNVKISESNYDISNNKELNGGDNNIVTNQNNNNDNNTITNQNNDNNTNDNNDNNTNNTNNTIDSKIDKIIEKDLKVSDEEVDNQSSDDESDDIKKSYKPEESEQYQEVFSNSEIVKTSANSLNSVQKVENLKRNKFFSNYLNF